MIKQPQQPDRVSYSFGMKLSLPTKYESADFHVSMTSDVDETESIEGAFNRVKNEVQAQAKKAYEAIRNSEEGLTIEQVQESRSESSNTGNAQLPEAPKSAAKSTDTPKRDLKALKQQIKQAFGVLEAQKKITKPDFVANYLKNKKTDDLSEVEVTRVIVDLREKFPELKL